MFTMDKTMKISGIMCIFIISKAFLVVQAFPASTSEDCITATDYVTCLHHCSSHHVCEAFPNATCHTRQGKCTNGCEVFYKFNNKEVDCNPRKKAGDCPKNQKMDCGDMCKATICGPYKHAPCRFDNCGGCRTEYYVDNEWRSCPPSDFQSATCPDRSIPWTCTDHKCKVSPCRNHPSAICVPDSCNNCKAEYYYVDENNNAARVEDCSTSVCPVDSVEVSCPKDLCNYMPCPNYPEALCIVDNCTQCHVDFVLQRGNHLEVIHREDCVDKPVCNKERDQTCSEKVCRAEFCPGDKTIWCRMNNCGGCKAEWYNSSTGEITTCQHFDILQERVKEKIAEHANIDKKPDVHDEHVRPTNIPVDTDHAHSGNIPVDVQTEKYVPVDGTTTPATTPTTTDKLSKIFDALQFLKSVIKDILQSSLPKTEYAQSTTPEPTTQKPKRKRKPKKNKRVSRKQKKKQKKGGRQVSPSNDGGREVPANDAGGVPVGFHVDSGV